MNFSKLVPSVFYIDITDGFKLFVNCLKFTIEHQDLTAPQPYCVLGKDGIRIMVFQDEQLANSIRPVRNSAGRDDWPGQHGTGDRGIYISRFFRLFS